MSSPHAFLCPTPPLSLGQKISGPLGHEKDPGFGPSKRLRKPRGPVRRIVVNRDPFRHLRLRETFEFRALFHRRIESPVLGQHCLIIGP